MTTTSPIFPVPVSDVPDHGANGPLSMWGRCAPWCETDCGNPQRKGHTVSEHGASCMSLMIGGLPTALDDDGTPIYGVVALAQSYMHGTYALPSVPFTSRTTFVHLDFLTDDDPRLAVNITSSETRTLAAALLRAADEADGITVPLPRHDWRN